MSIISDTVETPAGWAKLLPNGDLTVPEPQSYKPIPSEEPDSTLTKEELLLKQGYKPFYPLDPPPTPKFHYLSRSWAEDETSIRRVYTIIPYTIDNLRAIKHNEIKQIRDNLEEAPFEFRGAVFDVDSRSIQRLMVTSLGTKGGEDSTPWTVAEEGQPSVPLYGESFDAFFRELKERGSAIHIRYRKLKEAILSSQDWDAIAGITWGSPLGD